jgi:hypothetical protein
MRAQLMLLGTPGAHGRLIRQSRGTQTEGITRLGILPSGRNIVIGLRMDSFFALAGTASINDAAFIYERGLRIGLWNFAVIMSISTFYDIVHNTCQDRN